ncbi:MAG: ion transporter [Planctomycetota bacterium]
MPENDSSNEPDYNKRATNWQRWLRRFFARPSVEIVIGILVLLSVFLTLYEFAIEARLARGVPPAETMFGVQDHDHVRTVAQINEAITITFIIELTLRFLAASSKRRFFQSFWLDILATIPVFRVFRSARALRLLRLVRVFRLLGVLSRLSSHYPYILRRGAIDFVMICGLLVLAVAFGTVALMHFEHAPVANVNVEGQAGVVDSPPDDEAVDGAPNEVSQFDLHNSFWFSVYTLFAGEPVPQSPRTITGKIVSVFLMFMGLTIFAIFTGTISAFMIDRIRVEGRMVEWDELEDHIVICGWTPKTEIIIDEFRASRATKSVPIVVIAEMNDRSDFDERKMRDVYLIDDDFTKVSAQRRAGIGTARTCVILTDLSGGRSEQDADARTILAALTAEKLNPDVYTCAELLNRSYSSHLKMGKVNDFVVSGEYGAYMIAQAAMHRGLVDMFGELLTSTHGSEFYRIPIPDSWSGTSFNDQLSLLKTEKNAILVGVHPKDGETLLNPPDYEFKDGDEVVVISDGALKLS